MAVAVKLGEVQIEPKAFSKNSDGSWTCVQVTDIYAPIGAIRINPGMTFRKGRMFCGIDVAALLDQSSTSYNGSPRTRCDY